MQPFQLTQQKNSKKFLVSIPFVVQFPARTSSPIQKKLNYLCMTQHYSLLCNHKATNTTKVSIFDLGHRFSHLGHPPLIMATLHRLMLDKYDPTPPPVKRARGSYSNSRETNFDTNMVIILAALLCALVCALCLNSIVRCALRCSRRLTFETAEETAARLASKGLKKSALRQIPVAVYGSQGVKILATECPICLVNFFDGEKVRVLPNCCHGYHICCIDTWLSSHSSCPTCRQSLLEQPPGNSDSGNADAGIRSPQSRIERQGEVAVAVDEVV